MRPEQESDYQWPPITAATLLAQLDETRKRDEKDHDRRSFGKPS